jgi:hypothetical protein
MIMGSYLAQFSASNIRDNVKLSPVFTVVLSQVRCYPKSNSIQQTREGRMTMKPFSKLMVLLLPTLIIESASYVEVPAGHNTEIPSPT